MEPETFIDIPPFWLLGRKHDDIADLPQAQLYITIYNCQRQKASEFPWPRWILTPMLVVGWVWVVSVAWDTSETT